MDREELFDAFIAECKKEKQICGSGNPNAHILLIGQEHYSKEPIKDDKEWEKYLHDNYCYCSFDNPWVDLRECNTKWKDFQNNSKTWLYYQSLIDNALPNRVKRARRGERDFEFDAFTTELNNEAKPSSRIVGNDKIQRKELKRKLYDRIAERLELLKESDFIQSFPVIVLACGGYIVNREEKGILQINDTFGVKYDNELNANGIPKGWHKSEKGRMWFTTHHSDDGKKLVIHTWQLSRHVDSRLLKEMAKIINEHLKNLGLI